MIADDDLHGLAEDRPGILGSQARADDGTLADDVGVKGIHVGEDADLDRSLLRGGGAAEQRENGDNGSGEPGVHDSPPWVPMQSRPYPVTSTR